MSVALLILAGAMWGAGWALGEVTGLALAIVVSSPVIALALAPLVLSLLGRSTEVIRHVVYRDIEGRHFAYKGKSILVHEDLAGDRWLRSTDIRKVVIDLPRDEVLRRIAPDDLGTVDPEAVLYMRARGLDNYLQKSHAEPTIRFRRWLQREVIFPTERADQLGLAKSTVDENYPPGAA